MHMASDFIVTGIYNSRYQMEKSWWTGHKHDLSINIDHPASVPLRNKIKLSLKVL